MKITSATDSDYIRSITGLRDEYEHSSRSSSDRDKIQSLADKRFEAIKAEDIDPKTGGWAIDHDYDWDSMELGLDTIGLEPVVEMAKGGKVKSTDLLDRLKSGSKITEQEINLIKTRLNSQTKEEGLDELVQWIWDNTPRLSPEQNKKGYDFLMNLWKSPTGKERANNPFGYREQAVLANFSHFELAGLKDNSLYGQRPFYIPVYDVVSKTGNGFQYYYDGKMNIVGAKGGEMGGHNDSISSEFGNYYAMHGAVITGGSYFNSPEIIAKEGGYINEQKSIEGGKYVVKKYNVGVSNTIVYSAWVRGNEGGTIDVIGGQWYSRIGTIRGKDYSEQNKLAYHLINMVYPESSSGKRIDGEIEVKHLANGGGVGRYKKAIKVGEDDVNRTILSIKEMPKEKKFNNKEFTLVGSEMYLKDAEKMAQEINDAGYEAKVIDQTFKYLDKHPHWNQQKRTGIASAVYKSNDKIAMASGGEVSEKEKNQFIEYVNSFYGKKGVHADMFPERVLHGVPDGATESEIEKAVDKYLKSGFTKDYTWGGGDSLDRERVRDIMLENRAGKKKMGKGGGIRTKYEYEVHEYKDGVKVSTKSYESLDEVGKVQKNYAQVTFEDLEDNYKDGDWTHVIEYRDDELYNDMYFVPAHKN